MDATHGPFCARHGPLSLSLPTLILFFANGRKWPACNSCNSPPSALTVCPLPPCYLDPGCCPGGLADGRVPPGFSYSPPLPARAVVLCPLLLCVVLQLPVPGLPPCLSVSVSSLRRPTDSLTRSSCSVLHLSSPPHRSFILPSAVCSLRIARFECRLLRLQPHTRFLLSHLFGEFGKAGDSGRWGGALVEKRSGWGEGKRIRSAPRCIRSGDGEA